MGRKIPGKKHRTVKDPYKQHAQRFSLIKNKINKAPKHPDEQPMPRSLQDLIKSKNKGVDLKRTKNIADKRVEKRSNIVRKPANPVKGLKRLDGESTKSFALRISEGIKLLKHDTTIDEINKLPELKETDDEPKKKSKRRKKSDEPRLTKSQKKSLKIKEHKQHVQEKKDMENYYAVKRDDVKFGEIVHEPPSLKIKPRKAETSEGAPRPARKDLLLNRLFTNDSSSTINENKLNIMVGKKITSEFDLKGKRKNLPESIRENLEKTQREAIETYRSLKSSKARNS